MPLTPEALDVLTVEQLKKIADKSGVELAADANKAEIIAALAPDEAPEAPSDEELLADLRAAAAARGLDVPDDADRDTLLELLATPDQPVADIAEPDDSQETREDLPDGRVAAHRPVTQVNDHGDWRDPFSGHLVFHGQTANPANGAHVQVPADRRRRKDDLGQVYVPIEVGDDVVVISEVL